jgi:hypothetical protein
LTLTMRAFPTLEGAAAKGEPVKKEFLWIADS